MSNKDMEGYEEYTNDYYEHMQFVADPKQTPIRLDKFLQERMYKVSRNRIQNAVKAGSVRVNDKVVKPNFKVKPGHQVDVVIPRPYKADYRVVPQNIPLDIRYEDDDLLVVYKPAGMVVHPAIGHPKGTLVNALAYHFEDLPVPEGDSPDRLGLVHRIDKETSGLLVVAKTDIALTHLAKQFFDHTIERTYNAIVWGDIEEDQGTIDEYITRNPKNRLQYVVDPERESGKHAVTHYKVLERFYYVTLVQCNLETGRTHQIRVHMKYKGHTLFNDSRYGGDEILKGTVFSKYKAFVQNTFTLIPRHALHAKSLGFEHPTTGEHMYFETELPDDMQAVLERWRNYVGSRKELQ